MKIVSHRTSDHNNTAGLRPTAANVAAVVMHGERESGEK